jgi:hypothetical protein
MALPQDKYFFLLGGQDLEMITIRKILKENGLREKRDFLDKKLTWGACLSAYQNDFHPQRINVGIELIEDISPPDNYLQIDHHNELDDRPSSLEQVADLLDIQLNRFQLLVAANDKGYIPAMKKMNATEGEIQEVRKKDRAAQGVTEEDENRAILSIQHHLKVRQGITIVESFSDKFSPITDRLVGQTNDRLLIYYKDQLTYYGMGKKKLVKKFQNWISEGKAYSGGGADGFFGIAGGHFSPQEILQLKDQILNILK